MISTVLFFVCLFMAGVFMIEGDTFGMWLMLIGTVLALFWNR